MSASHNSQTQRTSWGAGRTRGQARRGHTHTHVHAGQGQTLVEFAMISVVLLGLLFGIVDLARAAFVQHEMDNSVTDLARSYATITGYNTSGDASIYVPTPLDPLSATTGVSMTAAMTQVVRIGGGSFLAGPLGYSGPFTTTTTATTVISNAMVTVTGAPDLVAPTEITVTVTAPYAPTMGMFLGHKVFQLSSTASVVTPQGQLTP